MTVKADEIDVIGIDLRVTQSIEHPDFAIAEFQDMKMQPALERTLRRRGLLKAWAHYDGIVFVWHHTVVMDRCRVLFVCTGNTCRSLMAEHIARARFGTMFESASAGLRPQSKEDADDAIYTLKSLLNIDAFGHVPRDVRGLDPSSFDIVVAMDNWVATRFREIFPGVPEANSFD